MQQLLLHFGRSSRSLSTKKRMVGIINHLTHGMSMFTFLISFSSTSKHFPDFPRVSAREKVTSWLWKLHWCKANGQLYQIFLKHLYSEVSNAYLMRHKYYILNFERLLSQQISKMTITFMLQLK